MKRLSESDYCKIPVPGEIVSLMLLEDPHNDGPIPAGWDSVGTQYRRAKLRNWPLSCAHPNNSFVLNDGTVGVIRNFFKKRQGGEIFISFKRFNSVRDFFTYPTESSDIGTFQASDLSSRLESRPLLHIKAKAKKFAMSDGSYYITSRNEHAVF